MSTISPEKTHAGMGATPHESGVAFRVWAPHADAVYVTGAFNDWSSDANPMVKGGNGSWYADIASARVGSEFYSERCLVSTSPAGNGPDSPLGVRSGGGGSLGVVPVAWALRSRLADAKARESNVPSVLL